MVTSAHFSSGSSRSVIASLIILITLPAPADAQSQPLLQITSPSDGTVVSTGQTISVVATPARGVTFTEALLVGENPLGFSEPATVAPFQFSVTIPSNARVGQYLLTAFAVTAAGQEVGSDPVAIDVERSDTPTKLIAEPKRLLFESQGEGLPLRIIGTFSDATVVDLTESSNIAYASSNRAVASVTPTGLVTAIAAGSASITASYGQSSQSLKVSVAVSVPPSPVSLSAQRLSFSEQPVGTNSSPQSITITNGINSPLSIKNVATTGDFRETGDCGSSSPIAPQGTCTVNVKFLPTANGSRSGSVDITTSLSVTPLSIPLTGVGVGPAVGLSTTSLTFDVFNGGNPPQTVSVTNTGSAPLIVSGVTSSGDFLERNDCVRASPILAGSTCTITVHFVPRIAGIELGSLTITDNVSGSPQIVNLAGVRPGESNGQ